MENITRPVLTVKKIESRYFARTEKTPPKWIALVGKMEVAYMDTRRDAKKAGEQQIDYIMSDRIGADHYRKRNAHLIWP